jgi:hypothetical protein
MQLKKKSVGEALAAATCTLLAPASQNVLAIEASDAEIEIDASLLEYREKDRVKVRELDFGFKWVYDDEDVYTGKVIIDSMTGSTPSGAVKAPTAGSATLTSPSGVTGATGVGTSSQNFVPGLQEFTDRRVGVTGSWERSFSRELRTTVGALFSNEDDYQSFGASGGVAYDLNQKLTTLEAGIGASYDINSPADGPPDPDTLQEITEKNSKPNQFEDGEKVTLDLSVGMTQVLSRRTVGKLTYVTGSVKGYLTDPYKYVTLIDDVTREPETYFHERRPDSRSHNAVIVDLNHSPNDDDVISASYRYFWDDWDIKSHTVDLRYLVDMDGGWYVQPHVRYYRQSAADFFVAYLDEAKDEDPRFGENAPEYASADYRLDKFYSVTFGLKAGYVGRVGNLRARLEQMRQRGTDGDYKDLDVTIFQITWSLGFK